MSSKQQTNIGPRDYKVSDIKRLFALSGNQCAKPDCYKELIAEDGHTVVAKICHIEAAKKGGSRFRQSMNNDERRSYSNLILLCDEHHQMIDNKANENKYTTPVLKKWKEEHISGNKGTKYLPKDNLVDEFIQRTKEYYKKIDSQDGPYEPILSSDYVPRNIESEFISILEEKGCLLLTGISFCGKSEMARNLASYFFHKNHLYKRVLNVRDAASFLESVGTNRVCFLEDPFGHMIGEEKSNELKRLQDLLYNIQTNHKIIVTSRKEVLQATFSATKLSECDVDIHRWHDITSSNISFLENVWKNVSSNKNIKEENISSVKALLSTNQLLQPGQLFYLANLPDLKSESFSQERLYSLAQVNAREVRQSIESVDRFTWKVFLVFGLCCDTVNGISYDDLAYILDSNKKHLSLEPEGDLIRSFSGKEIEDFVPPNYEKNNNNISDYELGIDLLEERGYIQFEYDKYVFSHPQYREIAKGFMTGLTAMKQRQMLPFIQNSLTCLNPNVAHNVSKNINFIIDHLNQNSTVQLIKTVFAVSEKSYYPKVLDQCYLYLLQNFRSKEVEKYQRELLYKLQSSTDNSNIIFVNSQPIKWRETSSISQLFISAKLPYQKVLENINNGIPVSSETIWATLLSVKRIQQTFDIEFLEYAFKSGEVFIRNLVAYNYFVRVNEFHDSFLKDKILLDEQPAVLFYALKGFLQGIPKNGKNLNKELTERFLYFFEHDEIFCIRSSNLMTNFSTDYASDSIDWKIVNSNRKFWIWRIWADLFIAFMRTFPKNVRFSHSPRFSGMMNKAKEFVYPEQAVKIAKGLLGYIEANLRTRVPNNFEMHLMDFLIDATQSKPQIRLGVFKKLIANRYTTTYNGYSISWAVSRWDTLELKEKEIIIEVLKSSRVDVDWLKAILVNSCIVTPTELQQIIFGESRFLEQPIEDIIANTPKSFLEKMILVYAGKDGALQEIGLSYSNNLLKSITLYIAKNNQPIQYNTCVLLFLTDILNGVRKEEWKEIKNDWFQTVQNCNNKDKLVELVLYQVARTSFIRKETKYVFKTLIDEYFKSDRIEFLANLVASNIEELTYISGDRDVFYVLNSSNFLYEHIFPRIPRNNLLLNILIGLEKGKVTNEDIRKYLKPILNEKDEPIHFRLTFQLLEEVESKNLIDDDIAKQLKTIPNDIQERYTKHFETEEKNELLDDFIYFLD